MQINHADFKKHLEKFIPKHKDSLVGARKGEPSKFTITNVGVGPITIVNQIDPVDQGGLTASNLPLWGATPSIIDVNQGQLADCYFLAAFGSIIQYDEGLDYLKKIIRMDPDGDGKVLVSFFRGGMQTDVELTPTFAWSQDHAVGSYAVQAAEKAYAFFRSGADTFISLNYGFSSAVFNDLNCQPASIKNIGPDLFTYIRAALLAQMPLCAATPRGAGLGLIENHEYTITAIDAANNVTMRNPWGNYLANPFVVIAPSNFVTSNFSYIEHGTIPAGTAPPVVVPPVPPIVVPQPVPVVPAPVIPSPVLPVPPVAPNPVVPALPTKKLKWWQTILSWFGVKF